MPRQGLLQRGGKVHTYVVSDTNVAPQSVVIIDAHSSYKGLNKFVSQHITVKHSEGCYVTEGDKHTNGIAGF